MPIKNSSSDLFKDEDTKAWQLIGQPKTNLTDLAKGIKIVSEMKGNTVPDLFWDALTVEIFMCRKLIHGLIFTDFDEEGDLFHTIALELI